MDLLVHAKHMKNIHMNFGIVIEETLDLSPPDFSLPSSASLSIKHEYVKTLNGFNCI